jgi:hypothetical protein
MVLVCVNYDEPVPMKDKATGDVSTVSGYFRTFGVTLSGDEKLEDAISPLVDEGSIAWHEIEFQAISDEDDLNDDVRRKAKGFGSRRIWYEGPHFLFP